MIRPSTILWAVLVILAGAALFTISYSVKEKEEHLAQLQEDITHLKDESRVLNAEWSYLNQPERLEKLMRRYSSLQPMKHQQLVSFDALPSAAAPNTPTFVSTSSAVIASSR